MVEAEIHGEAHHSKRDRQRLLQLDIRGSVSRGLSLSSYRSSTTLLRRENLLEIPVKLYYNIDG